MDKEKIGGVAETMLQTLYARAKESRKPNHKIYDAKAIDIGIIRNLSNKIAVFKK